jgi:molybdenum cofactor synthesis domain-containing protein
MPSLRVAVVTCSDRSAAGEREDLSGPAAVESLGRVELVGTQVLPDDRAAIAAALRELAARSDVILTTGGTGLAPRDVTPEATLDVCERLVPGIAEGLRAHSAALGVKMAPLSRGVAGLCGRCLIVNLPGSPKAVRECMEYLRPLLAHTAHILGGGDH